MDAQNALPFRDDHALRTEMMRLRRVDDRRGLLHLAIDWATLAITITLAVLFGERRADWGAPWWTNVPVFAAAIVVVGGVLHRLTGLGHESSHFTLLRNKFWNDLVGDVCCFFPVWSTVHFYRLFHMAHHQYVNDPNHDPDLKNMGPSKRVDQFPMTRWRFLREYWLRPLTSPLGFARFLGAYLHVNVLGKGANVYMERVAEKDHRSPWPRPATWLGLLYVFGLNGLLWVFSLCGLGDWVVPAGALAYAIALATLMGLPRRALFQSPFRQPYGPRLTSASRLFWFTALVVGCAYLREVTGGRSVLYVTFLYIVPMASTFPLFLLLRDVYQHANSDDDRVTNTRVFRTDRFTRWAIFVHGQDLHTPHHLCPAVPHYNLEALHRLLRRHDPEYAARVVECHGTFWGRDGKPAILDVLGSRRTHTPPERAAS